MAIVHDIILGNPSQRNSILNASNHRDSYECILDTGFSIDHVVTLTALHRGVINDRKQWFAVRREVYSSFAEHDRDSKCNLSSLSEKLRDEIAEIDDEALTHILANWPSADIEVTPQSLALFVSTCRDAKEKDLAVMIKSYELENLFETALLELPEGQREDLQQAFALWDSETQRTAHDKIKHLQLIGHVDCLETVREEIEQGLPHCATLSFLTAIQKTVQNTIANGINGIDYLDELGSQTRAAIGKFNSNLTETEQLRVLRAFAITLMSDIVSVVEDGHAFGLPDGPTAWQLMETDRDQKPTGTPLGNLHGLLDGDDEFWPGNDEQ